MKRTGEMLGELSKHDDSFTEMRVVWDETLNDDVLFVKRMLPVIIKKIGSLKIK